MSRRVIAAALGALLWCGSAAAGAGVAALAPGQLRMAESLLEQAQAAFAAHDYERARRLAAQAGLDARLAYGMSDSQFLRRDAREVHEQSARLRWLTGQKDLSSLR
jgi:hypothetical protein